MMLQNVQDLNMDQIVHRRVESAGLMVFVLLMMGHVCVNRDFQEMVAELVRFFG